MRLLALVWTVSSCICKRGCMILKRGMKPCCSGIARSPQKVTCDLWFLMFWCVRFASILWGSWYLGIAGPKPNYKFNRSPLNTFLWRTQSYRSRRRVCPKASSSVIMERLLPAIRWPPPPCRCNSFESVEGERGRACKQTRLRLPGWKYSRWTLSLAGY